uniref:Uncharacterized protein n=1 Tax=Eutreptiella gymnastica TaxID=73025 RepID=A0A7S1HWU5_9EUGL|mmetsp:Transcript_111449/g.193371  ORF Transcript_111449/g.193371 Transcript_111449/m.193371 type:complete len:515 (+) Transcript_111449:130-1674(+)
MQSLRGLVLLLLALSTAAHQEPGWCATHSAYMLTGDGSQDWAWKPDNPCGYEATSPASMLALLTNTTLLFAGDSISRYQWCALHGILTGGPYGCGAGVQITLGGGSHMMLRQVPSHGIRLFFTWMPSLEFMSMPANLLHWLNITDLDAAIFNSGIHLWAEPFTDHVRTTKAAEWALRMVDSTNEALKTLQLPRPPLLVWRETTFSKDTEERTMCRLNERNTKVYNDGGYLYVPMFNLTRFGCTMDRTGHPRCDCTLKQLDFLMQTVMQGRRRKDPDPQQLAAWLHAQSQDTEMPPPWKCPGVRTNNNMHKLDVNLEPKYCRSEEQLNAWQNAATETVKGKSSKPKPGGHAVVSDPKPADSTQPPAPPPPVKADPTRSGRGWGPRFPEAPSSELFESQRPAGSTGQGPKGSTGGIITGKYGAQTFIVDNLQRVVDEQGEETHRLTAAVNELRDANRATEVKVQQLTQSLQQLRLELEQAQEQRRNDSWMYWVGAATAVCMLLLGRVKGLHRLCVR